MPEEIPVFMGNTELLAEYSLGGMEIFPQYILISKGDICILKSQEVYRD